MAFGDTIAETVLGKPTAPEDTNGAPNTVAEGAAVNTAVGITAHSTFANGNASLDYSLSADSSGGGFKIDQNTGVVTVADPSKIDFESAPGHVYTITVLATKNNNFSSSQTFTIGVTDVAPSAPVDSNAAANTVLEGAANGTAVGVTASSTDVNGGAVTYSLIGDTSGGGFTVNATTGVVTVADGSKIDFESSAGHAYTVTVQSSDGTLTSSQAFTINVGDVALSTPTDTNGAANSVAEGAAAGTTVGITARAVDPSGPATTYSLIGDTSAGGFTINASTGVVTVANPAKIDFESSGAGHSYNITVQATNGVATTSQVFTVGVTDVAPSAPTDSNGAANTVVEGAANGTVVGVTAASTDVNGGAVTYSLTGDTSGGGFTINATTGVITVADSTKINYETAPGHAYTVTAQASDGTLTNSQTFTIAVTDVAPLAPVDSNGATNTVAEGAANGSTVGVTAFSTDVNGPGVTYSLTGDTSGGGFTINSTTGVITVADSTKLDYETGPAGHTYTVTAQASDGTLTNSQAFTIALTDVAPTAPVDTNAGANTVAEGAANGSTVGITASSVDPNGPATTYSLTDNAGGRFAINSSTGVVTVANGAAIDFETAPGHAYGITVQATNGALTTSSAFSIGVTDVGPSTATDTNGAADSVFEGAANGTVVGITASSTDPGGGPAPTYTLTDSAGGRFAIDATTGIVTVANGAAIDFETAPGPGHSYGITVQSTAGALSTTQTFSIGVGNVNEAPAGTDKAVLIAEDTTYTFGVADFGFSDPSDSVSPNSLQAVKITTVPGAGTGTLKNNGVTVNAGDSVSAADIAAGLLVFTPVLDGNGSPLATFTFQVQDNGGIANGGVDLDQSANTFTINVNAGNDAPINSVPGTQSVNEEATLTFSTGTGNAITISDVDIGSGDETVTLTVTNGTLALGSTAGLTSFTNNAASITLTGTVANVNAAMNGLTYTGNLNFNGADSLIVSTNDNGNTGTGGPKNDSDPITINVAAVNDAPVNGVPAAQTVNEDTNLVFTGANAITISDVDGGSGDETVTLTVASGTLALGSTLNLTSFTNNAASITLTGTVANINTALNGLTYHGNLNFNGTDSLSIVTHDNGNTGGGDLTDTDSVTINVTAVNDAPVVAAGHTLNYTENQVATALDPAITVSDVDSANLASATVQITGNYVNGEDVLGFTNQNGITGSFNAATGTLTLTGSSSVANYQTALASVTYVNTSDNPSGAARTVTITTNDGALNSVAATDTINVTPVNDAPVVTAGHTLNYTENQAATALDTAITVSDVDSANLASATVQITGNYVNGQDVLGFTNQNGITGSFNAATGTLTLTGSSSVANYQTALASVTYVNTSENPSGAARTVTITTNDGTANSVAATDTINVTPVNDAPVATAGHTLAYTENQAATAIDAAITVSDVDNANLASATVQITGNYVNGQDVLGFTNQNGITGSFNAATGTLTLTGASSVANYQTALDSVTYTNTSDDPSAATRTVTIITNDGTANSVAVTDTITVAAVNDAPTLAATGNNPNYSNGVDLFSGVTASTVEAGQSLDQLKLTVTNISGTATDSLSIDGVTVALTDGNVVSTSTPGVTATVAVSGSTATVTIDSTPGLSNAAMAALVDGISYTDTNINPGDPARVVTITQLHDTGGTTPGVDTTVLNITSTVSFDIAPTVTAGHTLNYTENQVATSFDPAITVTDPDNANLVSATVQITGGYVNGEDVLGFTNQNGISGSFNAATGTLTLTGSSSVANYQTALASVTYVNTSDNPSGAARTVTITANDGFVNSTPVTDTINVTPVNDAPVVTAGHTLNYTENQAATALDTAIAVSDVDNANLASATVQITGNYVNGQDVLGFTNQNGITGSFNAGTGTLTLTGSSSVANYQTALASVTYVNTSENPSGLARTVTIITNDGTANSVAKTDTINVTPVNDAPVTAAGGTLNYTENQAATAIDATVTVSDVDNANLSSATVQITGGYVNGQDILGFTTQNGITGVFNAATGTMTLSGSSSVANYQTALRSVTYFDNSDNPSGADRTVTYTANDGTVNSNSSTSTIHVTPVNDAPVVTATGTLAYTENQAATAIAPALTVTDVDTGTLTTATVQISANYVNGEDVLAFTTQNGITGVFNAATGTMTLSGTASVANYQTAMESVTYVNTSENPSTAARTVTFNADDGQAANHLSAGSNHTITVASIDDAPINNNVPGPFTVGAGFTHTVTGLSITDVDAGSFNITTTFTAGTGTVSIGNGTSGGTAGISGGATVTTNGTGGVTLTGTVAQINLSLAGNNVVYTAADAAGNTATTLQMATNDQGHTGTGGPITDTDTINIGVIPQVWFINTVQTGLDATATRGSQTNPFADVAEFNAASLTPTGPGTNDYIYVKAGTYSGDGINLKAGQTLLGDDQALSFTNPLNPGGPAIQIEDATGARPTIHVTTAGDQGIDVDSGNTIRGINIQTDAGNSGLDDGTGANNVGTLTVSNVAISGVGKAVDLDGGGTLAVTLESISSTGATADGLDLTGMGGSFAVTGGTTISNAGTTGIHVQNSTAGAAFNFGNTNVTGAATTGVDLASNAGNVTFADLDINGDVGARSLLAAGNTGTITSTSGTIVQNGGSGGFAISGVDAANRTTLNMTLDSLNVSNTGSTGADISQVAGSLTIGTTTVANNTSVGVQVRTTAAGSTMDFGNTTVSGTHSVAAVRLGIAGQGNAGNVTFDDLDITNAAPGLVATANTGTTTVSAGTISTGTGTAIDLATNTGGTFNFGGGAGGVDITTTSGTGFSATGGGTVSVTGAGNTINTTSGTALNLANVTVGAGGVTFDSVNTTSAANAIVINTVTGGAININGGSIAGATSRGVDINASANDITIASSIGTTATGRSIEVTGTTGSKTIAFSGAIDDNGLGVNLATNTGTTMNFTGGLQIDTASGSTGFSATGGGTVNVTGASNHIASTGAGGTALNITGTTIGASNVTFHDINSNGATNGIVLNSTGTSGHLTVTGNGVNVTNGTNSSGGQILNSTGDGIVLTNTSAPSFTNMLIQNAAGSGINANGSGGGAVNGFTFQNGKIDNTGTGGGVDSSSIAFNASPTTATNLTGAVAIVGNVLTNSGYHGVDIQQVGGTISSLNISSNTITSSTSAASSHGSGIRITEHGTASAAANITGATINNNTITNFPSGAGIIVQGGNTAGGPAETFGTAGTPITITGNTISGQAGVRMAGQGINMSMDGVGSSNFNISNNTVSEVQGVGIAFSAFGNSTATGVMNNNTVTSNSNVNGQPGIAVGADFTLSAADAPSLTITLDNNTTHNTQGNGILALANGNGTLDATITNNHIDAPLGGVRQGILIRSGNNTAGEDATVFLDISGNTSAPSVGQPAALGIGLRKQGTSTTINVFGIEDLTGAGTSPNVENYVNSKNPAGGGTLLVSAASGFTSVNRHPMLAADGGVQASSPGESGEMHLNQAQLDSVVAAAIGQWAFAGASANQLAALQAIHFVVADLDGNSIGNQSSGRIAIDTDAAGHGWFIDPTPNDSSEFTHALNASGTDRLTDSSSAAAGNMDLLTVVTHELGHVLGLDDSTSASDAHDLMYINLVEGERRMPDATDVAQTAEADIPQVSQAPAGTPIIAGNAASNTIDAGNGGNLLFGGAGADNFVFGPSIQLDAPTPAQITHVADYSAAQGDTFDFSAITSAFHNSGVSDALVVRAVEDASGKFAMLQVDHIDPMGLPSAPNWVNVAQLDGVHAGDSVNVLIDSHHSVHLAQIHVDLLV